MYPAFIIHNSENSESIALASRCLSSCKKFGQNAQLVEGVQKATAEKIATQNGLFTGFDYVETQCVRPMRDSQVAVLLAHRNLWQKCADLDQPILIFEHDAILTAPVTALNFRHILNLQRTIWDDPSWPYFQKLRPLVDPIGSFGSAKYVCLPGTGAYGITPTAARILLAIKPMLPADLFINKYSLEIDDHPEPMPVQMTNDISLNV